MAGSAKEPLRGLPNSAQMRALSLAAGRITLLATVMLAQGAAGQPAEVTLRPLSDSAEQAYFQPLPGKRLPLKLNQPNRIASDFDPAKAAVVFVRQGYLDRVVPYDESFLKTGFPGQFDQLERYHALELPVSPPAVAVYETATSSDSRRRGSFLGSTEQSPRIDRARYYDAARGTFSEVALRLEKPGYEPYKLRLSAKELTPGKRWESIALRPEAGPRALWLRWKARLAGANQLLLLLAGLSAAALPVGAWLLLRRRRLEPVERESLRDGRPQSEPTIGRYRLLETIGKGGTSEVFRAVSVEDPGQLPVALKLMHKEQFDQDSRIRFEREVKSSLGLDHPALAKTYDWGETADGRLYLICELLQGESLRARLDRDRAVPPAQLSLIIGDIGSALAHLHERGLVHRDVKPDNIFLNSRGGAKLVDLGLARGDAEVLTRTGVVLGTPHYMPPEQIHGEPGPASDQYAVGVTCFECLSGRRPYSGELIELINKQVSAPVPRLREIVPDASELLQGVLLRMMAKKPGQRYPSMLEALRELREALESSDEGTDTAAFTI